MCGLGCYLSAFPRDTYKLICVPDVTNYRTRRGADLAGSGSVSGHCLLSGSIRRQDRHSVHSVCRTHSHAQIPAASSRCAPDRHALVRSATRGGRVRVVAMVAALGGSGVGDSGAGGLGRARGCRDSDLLQGVSRTRTVGTTPDEGRLGARLQVRDRAWHPATHIRGAGRGRQVPPPDKQQEVQQNTETEARREEGRHEHPRAPERHPVPPPRQLGRSAVIR